MDPSKSAPALDREVTRLEFFSDAVFAFMATLLVVSLEVPGDFHELRERMRGFPGFAVGFVVLTLLWARHRAFFKDFGFYDARVLLANATVLFANLFFVFPLKWIVNVVLAQQFGIEVGPSATLRVHSLADVQALFVLFTGGFIAVFGAFGLLYLCAWLERTRLGLTSAGLAELRFRLRANAIAAAVGVVALALALAGAGLSVGLPGWILVTLVPLRLVHRRLSGRSAIPTRAR